MRRDEIRNKLVGPVDQLGDRAAQAIGGTPLDDVLNPVYAERPDPAVMVREVAHGRGVDAAIPVVHDQPPLNIGQHAEGGVRGDPRQPVRAPPPLAIRLVAVTRARELLQGGGPECGGRRI